MSHEYDASKAGLPGYEGKGSGNSGGGGGGGKTYDVVKDFSWTSVPRNSELRREAPAAIVRSFELKESQFHNQLLRSQMGVGIEENE